MVSVFPRKMTAVLKPAWPFLLFGIVALVQYLVVSSSGAQDSWFYLFGAVLFGVLAVLQGGQVLAWGADEVERLADERELQLQMRAMHVAYAFSMLVVYVLAFIEALQTGVVFNTYVWIFALMGGSYGVAYSFIRWRSV